ncbi:unnamed protein product [Durusdinium trenchii]|uniref:Uncharacterized protein n=1 Tax=Durusdinium trenchii TaxID=1381693 RepID=A0ABP0JWM2_9DINO
MARCHLVLILTSLCLAFWCLEILQGFEQHSWEVIQEVERKKEEERNSWHAWFATKGRDLEHEILSVFLFCCPVFCRDVRSLIPGLLLWACLTQSSESGPSSYGAIIWAKRARLVLMLHIVNTFLSCLVVPYVVSWAGCRCRLSYWMHLSASLVLLLLTIWGFAGFYVDDTIHLEAPGLSLLLLGGMQASECLLACTSDPDHLDFYAFALTEMVEVLNMNGEHVGKFRMFPFETVQDLKMKLAHNMSRQPAEISLIQLASELTVRAPLHEGQRVDRLEKPVQLQAVLVRA